MLCETTRLTQYSLKGKVHTAENYQIVKGKVMKPGEKPAEADAIGSEINDSESIS